MMNKQLTLMEEMAPYQPPLQKRGVADFCMCKHFQFYAYHIIS